MQTDTQDLDAILAKMFIANVALGFGVTNTSIKILICSWWFTVVVVPL